MTIDIDVVLGGKTIIPTIITKEFMGARVLT
jgi:hypothetical protein